MGDLTHTPFTPAHTPITTWVLVYLWWVSIFKSICIRCTGMVICIYGEIWCRYKEIPDDEIVRQIKALKSQCLWETRQRTGNIIAQND
jgi:hypothetical protein